LLGPFGGALAALASACGMGVPGPGTAARLVGEVFAGVAIVIDGAWWAALSHDDAAAELFAVDRCLASHDLGSPDAAPVLDEWLTVRLGLRRPASASCEAPLCLGANRLAWPRLRLSGRPADIGLAGRTLHALWRPDDGSRHRAGPKRLLAPAPGALGRAWHEYSESRTGSP
jgi:hypothetical protein